MRRAYAQAYKNFTRKAYSYEQTLCVEVTVYAYPSQDTRSPIVEPYAQELRVELNLTHNLTTRSVFLKRRDSFDIDSEF